MPNDFSVQLQTEQQGKQIIGPMGNRGGFLGGLADFASGLVSSDVHRQDQGRAIRARNHNDEVQAGQNMVAISFVKRLGEANDQLNPIRPEDNADLLGSTITAPTPVTGTALPDIPGTNVAPPPAGFENGVPSDVAQAADRVTQVQTAVSQGRSAQSTLDLHMETALNDAIARHPDAAAEILTYFQSRGLQHYLYQDVQNQLTAQEGQQAQLRQSADAQVQFAVQHGLGSATTDDYQTLAERGRQGMRYQAEQAANVQRIEGIERQLRIGAMTQTQADAARRDTGEAVLQNVFANADQYVSPLIQEWSTLAASADISQTGRLDGMRQNLAGNIESQRVAARAAVARAGGPNLSSNLAAVESYFDGYLRMMRNVVSGDDSRYRANVRALEQAGTQLRLRGRQQLQMYTYLSDTFGQGTVNAMFADGILAHVAPGMMEQLAHELAGFNATSDPNSATIHMSHIAQLLRGNISLQDIPEAQRAAVIGTITPTARTANGLVAQAAAAGRPQDLQALSGALNGSTAVVDAVTSIQPGTTQMNSVIHASNFLGDRNFRVAVQAGIDNPTTHDQALALMTGGRAASARLVSILTPQAQSARDTTGVLRIEYQQGHGYRVVADRTAYAAYVARMGTLPGMGGRTPTGMGGRLGADAPPISFEEIARRNDQGLLNIANSLNLNLNMLANTRQYDSHQPLRGMEFPESMDYFATGRMSNEVAAQMTAAQAPANQLNTQIDALEQRIADMPNHIIGNPENAVNNPQSPVAYQPHVTQFATQYGIPAEGLAAVIQQESGWNPNIRGRVTPTGQSSPPDVAGLGQFLIPRSAARGQTLAQTRRGSAAARYGLIEVDDQGNITRDDRTNPRMAIEATAHYLSDLHSRLGTWGDALDAYGVTAESNGPGMAALRRRLLSAFGENPSE